MEFSCSDRYGAGRDSGLRCGSPAAILPVEVVIELSGADSLVLVTSPFRSTFFASIIGAG